MPSIDMEAAPRQRAAAPMLQAQPVQAGGSAVSGAAQGGEALADMAGSFIDAERETAWSRAKAGTYADLMALHGSLDQEQDPAAIRQKWAQGSAEIRAKYGDPLAGDQRLSRVYDEYFTHYATNLGLRADDLAAARVKDQGRASLLENLASYEASLDNARSDADYDAALHNGLVEINNKRQAGILGAEEAERSILAFTGKVTKIKETRQEEARLQGAYAGLWRQFKGDPDAAAEFLEDPKNQARLGLDFKQALGFIHTFQAQAAADERRNQKAQAEGLRAEKEAYWNAVSQDDAPGALQVLQGAKFIPAEDRVKLREGLMKARFEDDPAVAADLQRRVWGGELTDKAEIAGYVGRGISTKTAQALRDDVDSLGKEKPPLAGAINYYTAAIRKFEVLYQDDADMLVQGDRFGASLIYLAQKEKVGPYDPKMIDLADGLLKKTGGFMGKFQSTQFERDLAAGTLPYQTGEAAPAAVPASAPAGPARRIPPTEYEQVKAALVSAGKDASDDTIYAVWVRNRAKFKGQSQ